MANRNSIVCKGGNKMNYRTYQQILTRFFEYHNILFSQKPASRKRGHFTKCVLKRRRRNEIAKNTRRKQK